MTATPPESFPRASGLIIEKPGNNNPLRHPPQDIVIAETLQSLTNQEPGKSLILSAMFS